MDRETNGCVVAGNDLAMQHGLKAVFTSGKLPKGCSYVRRAINRLRKAVQNAVEAEHGELTFYRAALINSALRHETRACLILRWLRQRSDTLTNLELLAYTRDLGSASDARDKCLKALGLDRDSKPDVWAVLLAKMPSQAKVIDVAGSNNKLETGT